MRDNGLERVDGRIKIAPREHILAVQGLLNPKQGMFRFEHHGEIAKIAPLCDSLKRHAVQHRQKLAIKRILLAAVSKDFVHVLQVCKADRGIHLGHLCVGTDAHNRLCVVISEKTKLSQGLVYPTVGRIDSTAFRSVEKLRRVKARCRNIAICEHRLPVHLDANGMGCIVNDL